MQYIVSENNQGTKNKKAKHLNFHKGSQSHSPSQMNGAAKVQINSETAIRKLKNLSKKYIGVTNPYGFLTDLRIALGLPDAKGVSKYGVVTIPKEGYEQLLVSLRITNHQANANTYIEHDSNYAYNLSIVVRRKQRKNTFVSNENVILDEYVYYETKMKNIENPLTKIINGIIEFLKTGEYKDMTGVAFKNQSVKAKDRVPQNISVDKQGNYIGTNSQSADYVSENEQGKNCNLESSMTYSEKKLLYESIMHEISKIVKTELNKLY